MTTTRSGIPTTYRYNAMRSRLEARWAAFFDLVGWSWVYEPFDTGNWIPDFLIQGGPESFLVEVGPCVTWPDLEEKAAKPLEWVERQIRGERGIVGAGLGVHIFGVHPTTIAEVSDNAIYERRWARCGICDQIGLRDPIRRPRPGSLLAPIKVEPCGHIHLGDGGDLGLLATTEIDDAWGQAGSEVQWHP